MARRLENPGVDARHLRVIRARGKAAEHPCVDCGGTARDWSQIHDADPLVVTNYEPRCRRCHRRYDQKPACIRGHVFDEENTLRVGGQRICRTCKREGKRADRAQKRLEEAELMRELDELRKQRRAALDLCDHADQLMDRSPGVSVKLWPTEVRTALGVVHD